MDYTDWGQPVEISKPKGSEISDRSAEEIFGAAA
jgi:hypothetical protein